ATNALLERRGARVVLVTTRGFEDLLWLRRQDRAALYDLARDHPPSLVARRDVVGVAERMGAAGVPDALTWGVVARVVVAVRAPAAAAAHAASLALSGPAGGVVGARLVGAAVGLADLLTLDMGGTSADASLVVRGAPLADGAGSVGGVPLALPAVLIETVSAG